MHQNNIAPIALRKTHLAAAALLLASLLAVGPAEAGTWKSQVSTDAPEVLYRTHCSACHGNQGDGKTLARFAFDPQPEDFTTEKARKEFSRAKIIGYVKDGARTKTGKATAMVAWKSHLSPAQIETLADYVIVTFMAGTAQPDEPAHAGAGGRKGHKHALLKIKSVDYPYRLKANAASGQSLYAANCVTCHGDKGDGRGAAAVTRAINPRNFHDPDFSAFANGYTLFSAVSQGRGHMPAWDKKLSNQDIADVSEYVLQTYVRQRPAASRAK